MSRLILLLFFFLSLLPEAFSQKREKSIYYEMIISARGAVHVNRSPYYELGGYFAFTHDDGSDGPASWFGPFFSVDNSFNSMPENNGKTITGWRAGMEYNMAFPWGFRLSVTGHRAGGIEALRLCPEAGLSIYCLHLYAGYNIPLTHPFAVRNTGPQLTLIFGVPVFVHDFYRRPLKLTSAGNQHGSALSY
jgi:hypothetical protein